MLDMEPFTLVEEGQESSTRLFDKFQDLTAARSADHDIQYLTKLRSAFPELIVTSIVSYSCNLLAFANAGHAVALPDKETDSFASWRGWVAAFNDREIGRVGQTIFFAKYRYTWNAEEFIMFTVGGIQYVLKEPAKGENVMSTSSATDALITAVGTWQSSDRKLVWVYDGYWQASKALFNQVEKAHWDNVILDEDMKKEIKGISKRFFESKEVYDDLGVPWKRGIIWHGPPGNGKTISIKALMHTLSKQSPPIPTLYVKSAPNSYHIRNVFSFTRRMAPCLLVLEDIETIVTPQTRSYFFNEVDGLENNDGILMVASTNFLDKLDPGLSKRPSRFDRKYLFPLPNEHERVLYSEFWRNKLRNKKIDFPRQLSDKIAKATDQFSFAYLQEAFVASLLVLANRHASDDTDVLPRVTRLTVRDSPDDIDWSKNELWQALKEQIRILREQMEANSADSTASSGCDAITIDTSSSSTDPHALARSRMDALGLSMPGPEAPRNTHLTMGNPTSQRLGATEDLGAFGPVGYKVDYINSAAYEQRSPGY